MTALPGQPPQYMAFTTRYSGGRSLTLTNEVHVFPFFVPPAPPTQGKPYRALYDTGATFSAISPRVVADLALPSIGTITVSTAKGKDETTTHLVNIALPNKVMFHSIRVTKADLDESIDVLIGMDLLGEGDFAVTHYQGKTVFSYCWPSRGEIDFVAENAKQQTLLPAHSGKIGRNALCPCGSQKKYKKCHGK